MTAPAFATVASNQASATTLTVGVPSSTVANNLFILGIGYQSNVTNTTSMPNGWVLLEKIVKGSTASDPTFELWYKITGASETTWSLNFSATTVICYVNQRITGASVLDPVAPQNSNQGTGTTINFNAINDTTQDVLLMAGEFNHTTGTTYNLISGFSNASLVGTGGFALTIESKQYTGTPGTNQGPFTSSFNGASSSDSWISKMFVVNSIQAPPKSVVYQPSLVIM